MSELLELNVLKYDGNEMEEENLGGGGKWQKILAKLYKCVYSDSTTKTHSTDSVKEAVRRICEDKLQGGGPANILVTGSLLLVGSFLEDIGFTEEVPEGGIA